MVGRPVPPLEKAPSKGPAPVGGRGELHERLLSHPGPLGPGSGAGRARCAGSAWLGPASRSLARSVGLSVCLSVCPCARGGCGSGPATASAASLFPAPRLALGRRIRVFSGGGRTAVRTGLLAACSGPGMALRRRHLCFFRRANPTFPLAPGLPAPRRRPGSLPGSLGSPARRLAGLAAAPRVREAPQTAPRTAAAPAHFPFAGGWLCGAGEPRCGKPPGAKPPPWGSRGPRSRPAAGSRSPAVWPESDPN